MLDHRVQTFLSLCETKSYTVTAQRLNMTQPAVTQHIQYLENYYGVGLLAGRGKQFALSEEGELLQEYLTTLKANTERIPLLLQRISSRVKSLAFGATVTIGEYTIPPILAKLLKREEDTKLTMYVENTTFLQGMLMEGLIDFALLEGHFNQSQFDFRLFSNEEFIGVCSPNDVVAHQTVCLQNLLSQNLILRESGSGTRDILEQALYNQNVSVRDFKRTFEVGNMKVIKELCHEGVGITFLYQEAVKQEIKDGYLHKIDIAGFAVRHPFSFVYQKNSPDILQLEAWFDLLVGLRNECERDKMM